MEKSDKEIIEEGLYSMSNIRVGGSLDCKIDTKIYNLLKRAVHSGEYLYSEGETFPFVGKFRVTTMLLERDEVSFRIELG